MCTIGYHKQLNLIFKNRDKNIATGEVFVITKALIAVKSEGSNYYSLGVNKHSCAFAGAAVNTSKWTSLVLSGNIEEANGQSALENDGLVSPIITLSSQFNNMKSAEEMLKILLNGKHSYMGYNVILADREKAFHVELHRNNSHIKELQEDTIITNHFQYLEHGPKIKEEYPSSFNRLEIAGKELQKAVSIEDIFHMLKIQYGRADEDIWRTGTFSTISSTVVDIESHALYYSPVHDQDYARITGSIPPRGSENIFIEMSRYIDLPTYHNIERGHPFYIEMIEEIKSQIKNHYDLLKQGGLHDTKLSVLELGAGTGLCSLELLKYPFLALDVLEIDTECCKILAAHPEACTYNVIQGDAVSYCKRHSYDLVVSTFAHDHIHYNKRFAFAKNIFANLKKGGLYIMGGELLPYYSNDLDRKKALFKYHNYIIDLALRHDRVQLSELENNALKSGLDMVGDFKRHEAMFEEEMSSAGFTLMAKAKMGPLDRDDVGGVFVYTFSK
ncbi:MAG: methyltransferase domain-containing protein [Nitrospirae bacterium]|nr:MAG: methyltransferase domain-containing protein [Nitrospirota bacterium]